MDIVVTPHNEQEEKVLIAFLDSLRYEYTSVNLRIPPAPGQTAQTLEDYNSEIAEAEAIYKKGDSSTPDELKKNMQSW